MMVKLNVVTGAGMIMPLIDQETAEIGCFARVQF